MSNISTRPTTVAAEGGLCRKAVVKGGEETTAPRITPVELSHEILSTDTVRTQYKAGYCQFTVTSRFAGDKPLSDVFLEVIQRKQ